jgi:vacuolar protein sorting-associated protein 54
MQQKQAPFKDEDQIKVLELQACKRLNDEVLKTLCDLCQRHIASLLNARKEAHVKIDLGEMKVLWDSTTHFVSAMERISGTAGFGLKSTLLTQAKLFVEHLHEEGSAQLLAALDAERWVQADVNSERQAEIDRLTAGKAVLATHPSFSPVPERRFSSSLSSSQLQQQQQGEDDGDLSSSNDAADSAAAVAAAAAASSNGTRKKKEPTEAIVGEGRYKVVWSAVLLVSLLTNYLNVAANFPTLTMDVMQRVVDLLRLFNARTAQLVLGAGAIQATARLRSITAKHLALASQCLGLILVLLPHVRAALAAHLQTKQQAFLLELDRLRQEYAEHQERILGKFVGIIGELVAQSAANTGLRETDWDAMGSAACRFVEEVIKGASTMHKVLVGFLPGGQVQDVFGRVFDLLGVRLREYLEGAQPVTNAGRQRLVDEVSHLVTSLSMLRGVNAEVLTQLEMTIKEKYSSSSFSSSLSASSSSSFSPSTKQIPSELPTLASPSPAALMVPPPSSPSTPSS